MDYNSSFEVAEGDAFRDYNIAEKIHESPHTVIYRAVRKSDLRPVIVKRPKKEALSILSVLGINMNMRLLNY